MDEQSFVNLLAQNVIAGGKPRDLGWSLFMNLISPKKKSPEDAGVSHTSPMLNTIQNAQSYLDYKKRTDPIWGIVTGSINDSYKHAETAYKKVQDIVKGSKKTQAYNQLDAAHDIRDRMKRLVQQGY